MSKLYLQRHLKSQWNLDDRFAGWTDGPLTKEASEQAKEFAKNLVGEKLDVVYGSVLIRNIQTIIKVLRNADERYPMFMHLDGGKMQKWGKFSGGGNYLPVYVSEKLNERYYGKLQGLNKAETIKKYGEKKVHEWRRSFVKAPPGGESGKDVYERVIPFYKKYIEKDLKSGKNILVVASHNSLRAIVKHLEKIPDEKFSEIELAFGSLTKYEFNGKSYSHLQ